MDKICIITGGSSGLGLSHAERFSKEGYKVIVADIIDCPLENVDFMKMDLAQSHEIENVFKEIKRKYGTAHILINNGAVAHFVKHITQVDISEYDRILNTNLRGAYVCAKEFVKLNEGQNYGRIINVASTRFHQNEQDWELYGMSKGGIVSLTNSLCVSLIGTPITVNAISPGHVYTGPREDLTEEDHKIHPSNRVGRPSDISNVCLFLAQEDNDFINGANIIVDGGMTKKMIY